MVDKLRIGIVGAGFMGKVHTSCLSLIPDADVVMVSSRTEESARMLADSFSIPHWTTDWSELVSSSLVDAVDVVVPNFLHREVAVACAEAGKPFLIEKPLARNSDEAAEILKTVKKHKVTAVYGENLRYASQLLKAKSVIDEGGIGTPILIRVNEMHSGPSHANWFWDADLCGGGAAIDMGIHGAYVMEWLMGQRVDTVQSFIGTLKWDALCRNGAEDTALSIFRFENGALGELANAWIISGGIDVRMEVFGTGGNIYIDESKGGSISIYSSAGYGQPIEAQAKDRPHPESNSGWSFPKSDEWEQTGHRYELRHFVDCVREGLDPYSTLADGFSALRVIEAIYQSAESKSIAKVHR